MLIETSGSNSAHDEEKVNNFLTKCLEMGNVSDGTVTNEPLKIKVNISITFLNLLYL